MSELNQHYVLMRHRHVCGVNSRFFLGEKKHLLYERHTICLLLTIDAITYQIKKIKDDKLGKNNQRTFFYLCNKSSILMNENSDNFFLLQNMTA